MSEVRDAVARAIHEMRCGEPFGTSELMRQIELEDADAAIAAFLEAIKEQGWQIVPREATVEMDMAWHKALADHPAFWTAYRAMLAAAPEWKP